MENIEKNSSLKKVWDAELDILSTVDEICRKNGLKYSVAYGTMLGAIRHKGFIPWDDDVDIIMPREDYERLIEVWKIEKSKGYILQNKFTNWDFTQNFTKIRKDNTTFIHNEWERNVTYHTGIFIDVFPGDRVAPNKIMRKLQLLAVAINLLYSRNFKSRASGIQNMIEGIFLRLPQGVKKKLFVSTGKFIQKWNSLSEQDYFFPNTMEWAYRQYPADMFDELIDVDFAKRKFLCVRDADKVLRIDYGNYMELPPIEERVLKHHAIIMDAEHNLKDIPI